MIPLDQREFMKGLDPLWNPNLMGIFARDGWEFVTNGHALLRVRGVNIPEREGTPPIESIIASDLPNARTASMQALCDWAAKGGPYRHRCEYCESPSDVPECVRSRVGDIWINRCLLWHYLKGLPREGPVTIRWGAVSSPMLVATPDWELYVMPLDDSQTENYPFDFGEQP